MDVDNLVIVTQGEAANVVTRWESIERREKLRSVVFRRGKVRRISTSPPAIPKSRLLLIAVKSELHIWPQLTKDNVQRSYLNFKEDEWLIYDVCFLFWRTAPLMARKEDVGLLLK